LVGFPFPEADEAAPLPAHVENFLQSGPPPLACSYTSGVATAGRFFTVLIDIARRTNRRMILISPPPELVSHSLPETICVSSPIPHVDLFPRCAAAIHHGGIGTFANALAAGIPQLIVPFMHDQPEIARRAKALGVADAIDPKQFRAESAEGLLQRLLTAPDVRERCRYYAEQCRQMRALDLESELLERFSSTSCITEPAHL
jgi:UDP:flavonoid glycosyltransferase YjiC (YdhE family)